MSWLSALSYCKGKYMDLGTVSNEEEKLKMINYLKVNNIQSWIWLKKEPDMWQWTFGDLLNLLNWTQTINIGLFGQCVNLGPSGWGFANCSALYPFMCYRSLILINETKTWEDALQYCRMHYTDLAFAASAADPPLVEEEAVPMSSVWVGLRFLDGQWFWLNKEQLEIPDSLPLCPLPNYRCGAHNMGTYSWENRDCSEELSFLCY